MITTTGTQFTRNFGRFRAAAHKEPVSVTSHGNEDLVVISMDEYKRLKSRDRVALFAWELSPKDIVALQRDDIPEETAEYDHELEG